MHKIFFYNKFIIFLYIFRALCADHQEVKIVLYSIWYHHTCRWPSRALVESGLVAKVRPCKRGLFIAVRALALNVTEGNHTKLRASYLKCDCQPTEANGSPLFWFRMQLKGTEADVITCKHPYNVAS